MQLCHLIYNATAPIATAAAPTRASTFTPVRPAAPVYVATHGFVLVAATGVDWTAATVRVVATVTLGEGAAAAAPPQDPEPELETAGEVAASSEEAKAEAEADLPQNHPAPPPVTVVLADDAVDEAVPVTVSVLFD